MKNSVLNRVPKDTFIPVRQSYIEICGDLSAGILLGIFEYWTNIKLNNKNQIDIENRIREKEGLEKLQYDIWIYKTYDNLVEDSLGLLTKHKVNNGLFLLIELGFLEKRNNPKYSWDRTLQYKLNTEIINSHLGSLHRPYMVDGKTLYDRTIPKTTSKESLVKDKSLTNQNPIVGEKASEEHNNILNTWNSFVEDHQDKFKGIISRHKSILSKLKETNSRSANAVSISEAVETCIDKLEISYTDITHSIDNYFKILTSDDYYYSFGFPTIVMFLLSEKGVEQFMADSVFQKYKSESGYKNRDVYVLNREKYEPVIYKYNNKNILDTASQTYMGVGVIICKTRDIAKVLEDVEPFDLAAQFEYWNLDLLEGCIAAGFYQKCDTELLDKMLKLHNKHKGVI